jgi:hypothetical protein
MFIIPSGLLIFTPWNEKNIPLGLSKKRILMTDIVGKLWGFCHTLGDALCSMPYSFYSTIYFLPKSALSQNR